MSIMQVSVQASGLMIVTTVVIVSSAAVTKGDRNPIRDILSKSDGAYLR